MIYVVDIDNTVAYTEGKDYANSVFNTARIEKINELFRSGHTIIYHTGRGSTSGTSALWFKQTYEQLTKAGALFHELRMGKMAYDVWIDDKAINEKDFFK